MFNFKRSLFALAYPYYADEPTAAGAPVDQIADTNNAADVAQASADASVAETGQATSDEAPASVALDVPAEHVSLLERLTALLKRDETWVKDNIEAGITHLENMFK